MRDVAVDRTRARKYLTNTVTLRIGLWLATLPVMVLVCWFYWAVLGKLDVATAQAIARLRPRCSSPTSAMRSARSSTCSRRWSTPPASRPRLPSPR